MSRELGTTLCVLQRWAVLSVPTLWDDSDRSSRGCLRSSRVVTVFVAVTGRYSCGPQQRRTRPLTTKKLRLLSASTTTNYIITDWPHHRDTYNGYSSCFSLNVSASTTRGMVVFNVSWIIHRTSLCFPRISNIRRIAWVSMRCQTIIKTIIKTVVKSYKVAMGWKCPRSGIVRSALSCAVGKY